MARAPSNTRPQRSALSPRPCAPSGRRHRQDQANPSLPACSATAADSSRSWRVALVLSSPCDGCTMTLLDPGAIHNVEARPMNTQSNVVLVRDAYAAFGAGKLQQLLGMMTPDVVWQFPASEVIPWAGTSSGPEKSAGSLPPCWSTASLRPSNRCTSSPRKIEWSYWARTIPCQIDWPYVGMRMGPRIHRARRENRYLSRVHRYRGDGQRLGQGLISIGSA